MDTKDNAGAELAKLKAELAAKDAALSKAKAELAAAQSAPAATGVKPGRSRDDVRARQDKKRAQLMAETYRKDGLAHYYIPEGAEAYYRAGGQYYKPGSVVKIPQEEVPSYTWESVEEVKPQVQLTQKTEPPRPQDKQL